MPACQVGDRSIEDQTPLADIYLVRTGCDLSRKYDII